MMPPENVLRNDYGSFSKSSWQHPQIKAVMQLTGCIDIEFFMKKMTSRMGFDSV